MSQGTPLEKQEEIILRSYKPDNEKDSRIVALNLVIEKYRGFINDLQALTEHELPDVCRAASMAIQSSGEAHNKMLVDRFWVVFEETTEKVNSMSREEREALAAEYQEGRDQ